VGGDRGLRRAGRAAAADFCVALRPKYAFGAPNATAAENFGFTPA